MTDADTGPALLLNESTPERPVGCCGSGELAATTEKTATAPATAIHVTREAIDHSLSTQSYPEPGRAPQQCGGLWHVKLVKVSGNTCAAFTPNGKLRASEVPAAHCDENGGRARCELMERVRVGMGTGAPPDFVIGDEGHGPSLQRLDYSIDFIRL
jgi:hypothetical protein